MNLAKKRFQLALYVIVLLSFSPLCVSHAQNPTPAIRLTPDSDTLVGEPITIRLEGMPPGKNVVIFSEMVDRFGRLWVGESTFLVNENGTVDPSKQAPVDALWSDIDPTGPFWALSQKTGKGAHQLPEEGNAERIVFTALVDGIPLATVVANRFYRIKSVREIEIENEQVVGRMFACESDSPLPGIVVVPGSGGGIPEETAEQLASQGYAVLALAYFGEANLPENLELISLEYIDQSIDWFKSHEIVDPDSIGFVGVSKGGELALLVGARRKDLTAIVAAVPSTYAFQSISKNWGSTSSWSVNETGIPFVPYVLTDQFKKSGALVDLYEGSLDSASDEQRIRIEDIVANTLLLSGKDDQVWPSSVMCDNAITLLREKNKGRNIQHVAYDNVGHKVFSPGYRRVIWSASKGGTRQGQARAQADSWVRSSKFLAKHLQNKSGE